MLTIHKISKPNDRWHVIDSMDLRNTTYIVSDLSAKTKVQDYLLTKTECLPELSVLRVHEFWSLILKQMNPSLRQVNPVLIRSLLAEWLKQNQEKFSSFPGTADLLTKYIGVFLPYLIREERSELLTEWLKKDTDALMRWGSWFLLAEQAYQYLKTKNMISRLWVSGVLLGLEDDLTWKKKIILDIGAELSTLEVELIQNISKDQEVVVLCPADESSLRHADSLQAYNRLTNEKQIKDRNSVNDFDSIAQKNVTSEFLTKRFPTQLSEIKDCVSWVRRQLDSGIEMEKISILAADIETYWPILESYLHAEGIPTQKSVVCHFQSLPEVMDWLSALRLYAREISTGDLETNLFVRRKKSPIPYDEFQRLYTFIYDESDLGRKKSIEDLYQYKYRKEDMILRDDFIVWSLNFWPSFERRGLERIIAQILLECPRDAQLRLFDWLGYISELCAKGELTIQSGDSHGIHVNNLDSVLHNTSEQFYLLGLSKEALRPEVDLAISARDMGKVELDLGIPLMDPTSGQLEYAVEYLSGLEKIQKVYSFSETDLKGEPLSPSLFWVEKRLQSNKKLDVLDLAGSTRMDSLQIEKSAQSEDSEISLAIKQDLAILPLPLMPTSIDRSWSVSQIETLFECPFQFVAGKLFRLSDTPFADMDMDRMTNGQFVHELLFQILKSSDGLGWTDAQLIEKIEMLHENYVAAGLGGSDSAWILKKNELLQIARRFIDFEKDYRKSFPNLRSKYLELPFDAKIPVGDYQVQFKGRIDRVDTDHEGNLIVYDYKSSGQFTNAPSWIKNDNLQLLFYCYVLENDLVPEVSGIVSGAFYYVLSTMNREKGFRTDTALHLVPEGFGGRKALSTDEVNELYQQTMQKTNEALQKVTRGELAPKPKKEEICPTCKWNGLCRAKHLI